MLQIRPHPIKRRALHATQAFQPGQTIHVFDSPLLVHPTQPALSSHCAHCLRGGTPRACSRCHASFYCDAACQKASWTAIHSRECKILQRRKTAGRSAAQLPTPVRLVMQALAKTEIGDALAQLEGHVDCRRGTPEWADLEMMGMGACAYVFGTEGQDHVRRAVELLCKIQTNAFNRFDDDAGGQVGVFLDPVLAMANHSCVPNATVVFARRKALLVAERPIEAGDEMELSYTDYTSPLATRRQALAPYRFECGCVRCRNDSNVYQVAASFPDAALDVLSVLGKKAPQHRGATMTDKIAIAAKFCADVDYVDGVYDRDQLAASLDRFRPLVDDDLWAVSPLPNALSEISIYYAQQQDYPRAVAVAALIAVECNPYRYPAPFHVTRLQNLLVMAKLLGLTAENSDMAPRRSLDTTASMAGSSSAEMHDVLAKIDQVSLSQLLLNVILMLGPRACQEEWELGTVAREMLQDIGQLSGRERELSLITAWKDNVHTESSKAFFQYAVVQQMGALASLGRAVLKADFGV